MADAPRLVAVASLDELYTAPPEEFVAARNALAEQLKAAGDKATAVEVTKLRRPPVSAWALNQVAREQPEEITGLLEAAAALAAALAAPADSDLRAAQRSFRGAIESVVRAAQTVVTSSGRTPSPTFQQAVQATLQAAAVDEDIAATLGAGVLAEDEPAPGFLFGAGPPAERAPKAAPAKAAPARAAPTKAAPAKAAPAKPPAATRPRAVKAVPSGPKPSAADRAAERAAAKAEAQEQARAEAEQREIERRRRARLAELRAEAQRLERRADRLEAAADKAEATAEEARADATEARSEVDAVLTALQTAEADTP